MSQRSQHTAEVGFDLMAMLLGTDSDEELRQQMGLVMVQIVDKVCEQQLDTRFNLYQRNSGNIGVEAVAEMSVSLKAATESLAKLSMNVATQDVQILALDRKVAGNELVGKHHMKSVNAVIQGMRSDIHQLAKMSHRLEEIQKANSTLLNEILAALKDPAAFKKAQELAAK